MKQITISNNTYAQVLHVMISEFVILHVAIWFGFNLTWKPVLLAAGGMLLFAAVKEGWWDKKYETPATAGSGWEDFLFYCIGIVLALIEMAFIIKF